MNKPSLEELKTYLVVKLILGVLIIIKMGMCV
jgi:hypothetical protein